MTEADGAPTMVTMTDLAQPTSHALASAPVADAAVEAAAAAAQEAGVRIRELQTVEELEAVCRLYAAVWNPGSMPPVSTELLRAFSKAGSYVGGAFEGETVVGACVGFFSAPWDDSVHSHIAGVSVAARGRRVGFALKLHQRAWTLLRGVSTISWTFDPLVSRNAFFNLVKLGARPEEYLVNFYGGMRDGINGDDDSDRLLMRWSLADPVVVAACSGDSAQVSAETARRAGAVIGLAAGVDGVPMAGPTTGRTVLLQVPHDIQELRAQTPWLAGQWRRALRDTLGTLVDEGATVTGFDRAGWYVVDREGVS